MPEDDGGSDLPGAAVTDCWEPPQFLTAEPFLQPLKSPKKLHLLICLFVHMVGGSAHAHTSENNLCELVLSYHVGPEDETLAVSPGASPLSTEPSYRPPIYSFSSFLARYCSSAHPTHLALAIKCSALFYTPFNLLWISLSFPSGAIYLLFAVLRRFEGNLIKIK